MTVTYSKHPLAVSAMVKSAGFMDFARPLAHNLMESPAFMGAATTAGVSMGVAGISAGYDKLKDMYERNQSYKGMLQLTPVLREHKDPASVKRYFNTLHRLNPHFMNDPMIAGAMVFRAIDAQESLGGLGQPSSALAGMAGELATGRKAFSESLRAEKSESDVMRHLGPMIQAGFNHADAMRLGTTPAGQQIAKMTAMKEGLDKQTRQHELTAFDAKAKAKKDEYVNWTRESKQRMADIVRRGLETEAEAQAKSEGIFSRSPSLSFSPARRPVGGGPKQGRMTIAELRGRSPGTATGE